MILIGSLRVRPSMRLRPDARFILWIALLAGILVAVLRLFGVEVF
jgi:hypothetical protein